MVNSTFSFTPGPSTKKNAPPPTVPPPKAPPSQAPTLTIPTIPDLSPPPPVFITQGSPPAPGPPPSSEGTSSTLVVGGAVGAVAVLFVAICVVVCCCRKKRKSAISDDGFSYKGSSIATMPLTGAQFKSSDAPSDAWGIHSASSTGTGSDIPPPPSGSDKMGNSRSYFTYNELAVATDNFSKDNLLGEGGFGRVYKGILPNGTVVAVKQLTVGGGQGEREFRAEVEVISRVHHRHLVSLVGYCVADRQRLLVYEFVPNGTLENNLHNTDMPIMEWSTRLKIGLGCARGLAYLHEDCHPKIIHRDIKSSNILLEENFEAKVADFGLAKLSSDTNTHVSTRVMGTFGYLAPEYAASGKLTDRSDVFSFGVVLLELVTGRRPIDMSQEAGFESLVEWARPVAMRILEDGHLEDLVDPNLDGNYDRDEMFRVIETAAACVRHSAVKRPRMAQVVRALESEDRAGLYQGMKPGQSMDSDSQYGSEYGGTSRYGGDSGEFDQNDHSSNSGPRPFHKQGANHLPRIESAEHSIAEEPDDQTMEYVRSESSGIHAFKPPVFGTQQFHPPKFTSGEYDPDKESSDFPGAYRSSSKKVSSYAPPRSGLPNNGMSGFMGAPPPPPGRYSKPVNLGGEDYVPIGKTVSFAPNVEDKKF